MATFYRGRVTAVTDAVEYAKPKTLTIWAFAEKSLLTPVVDHLGRKPTVFMKAFYYLFLFD